VGNQIAGGCIGSVRLGCDSDGHESTRMVTSRTTVASTSGKVSPGLYRDPGRTWACPYLGPLKAASIAPPSLVLDNSSDKAPTNKICRRAPLWRDFGRSCS